MYVILVNDDNSLSAPKKERIVKRSKLVDTFWFLVKPMYDGHDMSKSTVVLEYLKPISKKYKTEILELSEEGYEEYLKYTLPIDTEFTDEDGTVELQLSFLYVDIDADGNSIQRVRKTAPTIRVQVIPTSAWSDIIPDEALNALDKRIIQIDTQIKAINEMNTTLIDTKADNISYENGMLQLIANDKKIGDAVKVDSNCGCEDIEDGVPVVDFNDATDFVTPDDSIKPDNNDNVVEFDPMESPTPVNNVIEF